MEITPFTIAVPEPELEDLLARIRNTRWPSMSRPTGAAGCRPRLLAGSSPSTGPATSTGAPRRPGSTPSRSSRPTSTARRSTSCTSDRRSPAPRPSSCSTATRARSSSRSRMIGPLVDPEAHGGRAEDAFHVVVPSLPGLRLLDAGGRSRAGPSRSRRRRSTGSCRRSATSGTASAAATSAPGSPSSCASRPATASSARSSSPIRARSRRSTRRRPTT